MYRNKYLILWFSFSFLLLSSCGDSFNAKEDSSIQGNLFNSNGEWIYLNELNIKTLDFVDSVKVDENGVFNFQFKNIHKSSFYTLSVGKEGNPIVLLVETGEKLKLQGNAQNLAEKYKIQNSPGSELLKKLQENISNSIQKADSIYFKYRNSTLTGTDLEVFRKNTDSLLQQNQIQHYQMVKDFAKANRNSLAAIYCLYSRFGNEPVLNFDLDFDLFKEVSSSLSQKFSDNIHAKDLATRVNVIADKKQKEDEIEKSLSVGNIFPNIELFDKDNNLQKLTDRFGKNILVYFWAASDKNCWDINLKLRDLYKKYAVKKNFDIYAVSLDIDKMQWASAINIDKLAWTNVLGQQDTKSKYNLTNLPRFFLLDASGKIITKDITIPQLELFLSQ